MAEEVLLSCWSALRGDVVDKKRLHGRNVLAMDTIHHNENRAKE